MDWQTRLDTLLTPRHDGVAPITINPKRIYILPSGAGVLFAALVLAMLVITINYAIALGYALVFLLVGLGLIGMVHTVGNLWGIRLEAQAASPVFAGESAVFPLHLHEERGKPRFDLRFSLPEQAEVAYFLAAQGQTKVDLALPTRKRGSLPLPRIRLATHYPLGLFTAWTLWRPELNVLVFPKPILKPLPTQGRSGLQEGGEATQGGDDDFSGLREKAPADPFHHVAWRLAARLDETSPLLVKQFSGGGREELVLDWELLAGLDTESRLSILTGWVLQAEAEGHRYGLQLPGLSLRPEHGLKHQQRCLASLALFPA